MKLTLPVDLAPDPEQHATLVATMNRFNLACNDIAREAHSRRCANKVALQKILYYRIRTEFGLSSQLTIRAIAKAVNAYKRDKSKLPTFRLDGGITYDERILSWKGLEHVSLLTLGGRVLVPVRFGEYQRARLDRRRGQADLVLRDGKFVLLVTLDVPEPPVSGGPDVLGVDFGIVNLATDSEGTNYSGAVLTDKRLTYEHRRRNLQRNGSRSAKRKLKTLKGKQSRFQADTNHCISKAIVGQAKDTGRNIALEDLEGIRERIRLRRRQRSQHGNWAYHQLRAFIEYKGRLAGVQVVTVDPRNTSRTCPDCSHIAKGNRPNRDTFHCVKCGLAGPADVIAARNIRARALATVPMVAAFLASGNLPASNVVPST